jgi:hypothetical protein
VEVHAADSGGLPGWFGTDDILDGTKLRLAAAPRQRKCKLNRLEFARQKITLCAPNEKNF